LHIVRLATEIDGEGKGGQGASVQRITTGGENNKSEKYEQKPRKEEKRKERHRNDQPMKRGE